MKAYERLETVATTLVEGSVEVACAGKSFQIVPGEQFVYDKNNRVMDVRMVDTESICFVERRVLQIPANDIGRDYGDVVCLVWIERVLRE